VRRCYSSRNISPSARPGWGCGSTGWPATPGRGDAEQPTFGYGTVAVIAGIPISAGSLSFLSILLKFALTISAALLLIATTSFPGVCHALRRLGLPPALRKISPCGRYDAGGVFSKWLKKGSSDLIVLVLNVFLPEVSKMATSAKIHDFNQ